MARKWNNQGGSNFDAFSGKYKKPKDTQNIPKFEDLKESNSTSFIYKTPPNPKPQLGLFGDEIWNYEIIDDDPLNPIIDLTPKEPVIPKIRNPPNPSVPHIDPVTSSSNILPFAVIDEYELVVKFGLLVLRISSGQAYAARQGFNDARYDFSLVIKSSNPISLNGGTAATVNLITLSNSAQNPIYSLYNWLRTKIAIATNNDATGADPVLSGIELVDNVAQLPSTQFVSNSITCGLFYASGLQPNQICLNAVNKVFNFEPSTSDNPTWIVTYPGEILPLCLDINQLQVVSIELIPSTFNTISRGSGDYFNIRVTRDATVEQLASSLEVDIRITSPELLFLTQQLDPALYVVYGINDVAIGQISTTIPSLEYFVDIFIEPLSDPTKLDPVPLKIEIISSNVPDPTPDYTINELASEVNMIIDPDEVISTDFVVSLDIEDYPNNIPGSPITSPPSRTRVQNGQTTGFKFIVRSSITSAVDTIVNIDITGITLSDYISPVTFAPYPGSTITIPAGALSATLNLTHKDRPRMIPPSETLNMKIVAGTGYIIEPVNNEVNATTTRRARRTFETFDNSAVSALPSCPLLLPLEYSLNDSVFLQINNYNYNDGGGNWLGINFRVKANIITDDIVSIIFDDYPSGTVETLSQMRARYLGIAQTFDPSAVEDLLVLRWERYCYYIELGDP